MLLNAGLLLFLGRKLILFLKGITRLRYPGLNNRLLRISPPQTCSHRKSKDLQSSGHWNTTLSNKDRQSRSGIWDATGGGEPPDTKPNHKRKRDAYAQDDQRQYFDISESMPHASEANSDTGVNLSGKGIFGDRNSDVMRKKVYFNLSIMISRHPLTKKKFRRILG